MTAPIDPPLTSYEFDVFTASHDDVKAGRYDRTQSRVHISTDYTAAEAADLAACIAASIHGGMPTAVLARY